MANQIPNPNDIFQFLRMQNVLNPTVGPNLETGQGTFTGAPIISKPNIATGTYNPEVQLQQQPLQNPMQRYEELYKPETRGIESLYGMMNQIPQRNNPGILRKIAASVAGVGRGPEAAEHMLYAPYQQQMQDFGTKFGMTKEVAGQERQSNAILRQIASSILGQETAQRRIEETERHNQAVEATNTERARISARRAETYDFKARNPNFIFKTSEDGRIVAINPQDPTQTVDTGLKSSELSDADRINLQLDAAIKRIGAQEGASRRLEGIRQGNREKLVNLRAEKRATALKTDKSMSVTQDAAAWNLARKQFIADNPDYSDFWDESGAPTDDAVDSDDYADAVDQIRDRYNRIKARAGGKTTPTGNVAPPGTPPIKMIRIQNDKGQRATMPENKPIPNGWKKVGYVD